VKDDNAILTSRKSRAQLLAQTAVIAAVYGVGTYFLTGIAFGPIQVRVTDALLPVSWNRKIGMAGVLGVTLGVVISNVNLPLGLPDLLIGTVANAAVGLLAYWLGRFGSRKSLVAAALLASLGVALLVGALDLGWVYGFGVAFTFATVLVGELIACVGLGVPLNLALRNRVH
jgi:uncharacterized membrane protein